MLIRYSDKPGKTLGIIIICAIVMAATITGLWLWLKPETGPAGDNMPAKINLAVQRQPVIDYNKLEKDSDLEALIQER